MSTTQAKDVPPRESVHDIHQTKTAIKTLTRMWQRLNTKITDHEAMPAASRAAFEKSVPYWREERAALESALAALGSYRKWAEAQSLAKSSTKVWDLLTDIVDALEEEAAANTGSLRDAARARTREIRLKARAFVDDGE